MLMFICLYVRIFRSRLQFNEKKICVVWLFSLPSNSNFLLYCNMPEITRLLLSSVLSWATELTEKIFLTLKLIANTFHECYSSWYWVNIWALNSLEIWATNSLIVILGGGMEMRNSCYKLLWCISSVQLAEGALNNPWGIGIMWGARFHTCLISASCSEHLQSLKCFQLSGSLKMLTFC